MAKFLKEVGPVTYTEDVVKGNLTTIGDNELTFFLSPKTGTSYSHLWVGPLFSLPVNSIMEDPYTTTYADGGYSDTALGYLVNNVSNNIIVADISSNAYDIGINGLNFKIDIPLDPTYSGTSFSGLNTTTLYGAYMKTPLYDKPNNTGPCSCSIMDNLMSEQSSVVTTEVKQGLPEQSGINPESNSYYGSGIVYLFCDDIQRPNISASTATTLNSWSTGFGFDCPYTFGAKYPFNFMDDITQGYYKDVPVGAVDLLGGKVTIFNEDLVNAFDFTLATSGDSTSGATFPISAASATFASYDVEYGLNMTLIASKNEFTTSDNPTFNTQNCGDKVWVTYINLYDSKGNLVGVAPMESPTAKRFNQTLVLDLGLKF
jgi:hypothetical protein